MHLDAHFRRSFLTGLLIILPLVVTVWLFGLILRPVQRFATPAVMALINWSGLGSLLDLPGAGVAAGLIGLVLTVVVIYIVGLLGGNFIGRRAVKKMDDLALSIPLVKSVYGSARQLIETFYSSADRTFESVVLVEYPRKGIYTVGLVTAPTEGELQDRTPGDMVNVFVPTTPNPTSGVLILTRRDELVFLTWGWRKRCASWSAAASSRRPGAGCPGGPPGRPEGYGGGVPGPIRSLPGARRAWRWRPAPRAAARAPARQSRRIRPRRVERARRPWCRGRRRGPSPQRPCG
jgi:uncharacterized membrane protein